MIVKLIEEAIDKYIEQKVLKVISKNKSINESIPAKAPVQPSEQVDEEPISATQTTAQKPAADGPVTRKNDILNGDLLFISNTVCKHPDGFTSLMGVFKPFNMKKVTDLNQGQRKVFITNVRNMVKELDETVCNQVEEYCVTKNL
jgi:hypothetical protein